MGRGNTPHNQHQVSVMTETQFFLFLISWVAGFGMLTFFATTAQTQPEERERFCKWGGVLIAAPLIVMGLSVVAPILFIATTLWFLHKLIVHFLPEPTTKNLMETKPDHPLTRSFDTPLITRSAPKR